ncbi:MAG TPA: hypothetical protein VGF79_13255 [Bacteroidia bacterium]
MKLKSVKFLLLGAILSIYSESQAAKILTRKTENGGKNGYNSVERSRCSVVHPNGQIEYGYCINCKDPGREQCPTQIAFIPIPVSIYDQADIEQGNLGLIYALAQISNGNFTGSYNYNFTDSEGKIRSYLLTWNYSEDENGENINSLIEVERTN